VIAVEHDLALGPARQLEVANEHVPRIAVAVGPIALSVTRVVVSVTRILPIAIVFRVLADFDPRHLDITNIAVAIAWIEIHTRLSEPVESPAIHDRIGSERFGSGTVEWSAIAGFRVELCSSPSTLSAALRPRCARPAGVDRASAQLIYGIYAMRKVAGRSNPFEREARWRMLLRGIVPTPWKAG
jgi:hypothetical protein